MDYRGVKLNMNFQPGHGDVNNMPTGHGIYAEIHWPTRNIRIGEAGKVRARNRAHMRWADKHRAGTHKPDQAKRQGPIVDLARRWGSEGLEYYLISNDPRLTDRVLRVECEKFLHEWARNQGTYNNINRQRGYRTVN